MPNVCDKNDLEMKVMDYFKSSIVKIETERSERYFEEIKTTNNKSLITTIENICAKLKLPNWLKFLYLISLKTS
jgi:hypothetical protein